MLFVFTALCPSLSNPPNGMVTVSDFSEGGIATYSCDGGFELEGSRERICGSGRWSGMRPICRSLPGAYSILT